MKKKYKLLSLDIWDTILRRECHPDEVKFHVARYLYLTYYKFIKDCYPNELFIMGRRQAAEGIIARKNKSQNLDDEYTIREVFKIWLEDVLIDGHDIACAKLIDKLINIEISFEKKVTYLDREILGIIDSVKHEKLVMISDFYMPAASIREILTDNNFPFAENQIFSSSDFLLNKKSGRLFSHVHSELCISPEEHLHIGDSKISDITPAQNIGIDTIHFLNHSEEKKRHKLKAIFKSREKGDHGQLSEHFKNVLNPSQQNEISFEGNFSIVFISFVFSVIENALKKGHKKIYYFSREGYFFKKIHESLEKDNPFEMPLPKAEILDVSRIVTFGPSLREITLKEMMRLWNLYSTQSMKSWAITLDLDPDKLSNFWEKHKITSDESIKYPWEDDRVKALFNDNNFIEKVESELEKKRKPLKEYFDSKGFTDTDSACIVDIGWRGTIQDNISYLYPDVFFDGYYFGLNKVLNEQPDNVSKTGYIVDLNKDEEDKTGENILRYISPLEMLCNAPGGSVVGFKNDGERIRIVKDLDEREDEIFHTFTQKFQNDVLGNVKSFCKIVSKQALTSKELRLMARLEVSKLQDKPPKQVAKNYFKLNHNETFGLGKYFSTNKSFPYSLFIKACFSKKHHLQFKKFLNSTTWPHGFLIAKSNRLLQYIYKWKFN